LKSTLTLLFCVQRAILYPGQKILVVCPVKSQSKQFIQKIYDLIKESPNLAQEIEPDGIKTNINECSIKFRNHAQIFSAPYGENSLGKYLAQSYSNIAFSIGKENWKAEMLIRVEGYA
jgi:hypothetical protein